METPAALRWSKVIDKQEASGLTIRAFSRENGIKAGTLYWWRRRLDRSNRRVMTAQFIEVTVKEQAVDGVVLTVPRLGLELAVDNATDLRLVRKLVHALC